nr:MAG TPA_asm: hypothetical protein [Caudoviricetes sp.]
MHCQNDSIFAVLTITTVCLSPGARYRRST